MGDDHEQGQGGDPEKSVRAHAVVPVRIDHVQPIRSHVQSDLLPLDTGLSHRRDHVFARPKTIVSNSELEQIRDKKKYYSILF